VTVAGRGWYRSVGGLQVGFSPERKVETGMVRFVTVGGLR